MTDETIKDAPKRNEKGQFIGSGNVKGRPRGTKGIKHRASKAALETMLWKDGMWSFKALRKLAEQSLEKGDVNTAFKCLVTISGKFYELTLHNDRVMIQEAKDKAKASKEKDVDDFDDEVDEPLAEFSLVI